MVEKADVLVIVPHPDDAEFGAAGTVAKFVKSGKKVAYVICTQGDKGSSDREMKPEKLAEIRQAEQRAAAKILGVSDVLFLSYHDQELEYKPEFRKQLVRLIRQYRPQTVITIDPYQRYLWWHRDHRICGEVTMDAIFPYARDHMAYPDMLEEGLEPHKVTELLLTNPDKINYRVDITDFYDTKLAAIAAHKSQVAEITPERLERFRKRFTEIAKDEDYELGEGFHRVDMWW